VKRFFVPLALGLATLIVIFLGFLAFRPSSSHPPVISPSPNVLGDACLVGDWTLQREDYQSTDPATHASWSGLAGAGLNIKPNGIAFFSYKTSGPAIVRSSAHNESLTLRGSLSAQVHASKGSLTVTDHLNQVSQLVTLNGKTQGPADFATPIAGSGPYVCDARQLQIHLQSKLANQVITYNDTYLRGQPPSPSP
jgi:hypothetical protein